MGRRLLEARQGEAVLGKVQEDTPLAGLGTEGYLNQPGKGQKADLAGDHRRRGSRMEVVLGSPHPEVGTVGHATRCTLGGILTWT